MNDARTDARRAILTKALRMAPFDGWSQETLESAITTSEVDPVLAKDAFPGGIKQLLAFFMMEADRNMVAEAIARGLDQGPVRKQIGGIIRLRLTQLRPHREAIRRAVALHLLPGRAPNAAAGLWRTVDAIWHLTEFHFPYWKHLKAFVSNDAYIEFATINIALDDGVGSDGLVDELDSVA